MAVDTGRGDKVSAEITRPAARRRSSPLWCPGPISRLAAKSTSHVQKL